MAFLLHFLVLLLLSPHPAAYPYRKCEGDDYDAGSLFQSNLNLLLSSLSSTNSTFVTDDKGSPPNRAYGLFLCRGDITSLPLCHNCALNATQNIQHLCPFSKQATVWYDTCQLRYSDLSFNGSYYDIEPVIDSAEQKATDPDTFSKLRRELLDKLCERAAYNSSLLFATGTASVGANDSPEIYGLVQCTRDLSKDKCYQCLQESFTDSLKQFDAVKGGRVLEKSCNFRYETFKFFEGVPAVLLTLPPSSPPPSSTPTQRKDGKDPDLRTLQDHEYFERVADLQYTIRSSVRSKDGTKNVLIIVIPVVVVVILLVAVCIFLWRKRATKRTRSTAKLEEISTIESLSFDLTTLILATGNFSEENKLGEGGFGSVYKGKLTDGQEIAVKRLSTSSTQGVEELKNEFILVAKLKHRNLVKLLGICLEEEEKLLVYEYVPNGSLDNHLFDPIKCKQLSWDRRFNIISGIARGLFYLHEESHLKVIHRDLKASNILLDTDLNPKISDFGLARLFGGDETQGTTSRVVGTFGYMAPEYALHGHLSTKVDVYSYGVLALEIVTGRQSSSFYDSERADFLNYVWEYWSKGTILEIVDPTLENCSNNEVLRCIHVALLCVQEVPVERPPMSSVVVMLHSPSVPLQTPQQPMFYRMAVSSNMLTRPTDLVTDDESASRSLPISVDDASITELHPR